MSHFVLPEKQVIVNSDAQVVALASDGTPYTDGDITALTDTFSLEGFRDSILVGNILKADQSGAAGAILPVAPSAAVAGVIDVTCTEGAAAGDVFRVRIRKDEREPTLFQQSEAVEKRYQFSADAVDATAAATAIAAAINADPYAMVTASPAAAVVTLTALNGGEEPEFYGSVENATFSVAGVSFAVTTPAAEAINTYDYLKNINWAKNLDFDRNVEYFPEVGATYNSYTWEEVSEAVDGVGGHAVPGVWPVQSKQKFKVWVKVGLTLDTALADIAGDVDAIVV